MILATLIRETQLAEPTRCTGCDKEAEILMHGYADNRADIRLCRMCALQLSRKLLDDLCEPAGDRNG